MQAEVQDIGPCKKKLVIEVGVEEVKEALETGMGELRRGAAIPGFRRGHVPAALLEKRFGSELRKEITARLVNVNYAKAIKEKNIEPVSEPDFDLDSVVMKDGEPLKFEITLEVWPEFEPSGYEGMELQKPSTEPSAEEIDGEIGVLRTRTTNFQEVETEGAAETDFIIASYEVTADGKTILSGKEAAVRPSDSAFGRTKIEGLKDALVGRKAGEKVSHNFKVDADFPDEKARGKDATLALEITGIRRPHVPEVTDAWAKDLGFESLDELKAVVGRNVSARKDSEAENALKSQVNEKLLSMLDFQLPEDMVRRQQKDIMIRQKQALMYRGVKEEELNKMQDKMEMASQDQAARDLKLYFILSRIADKEKIKATEADVDMKVAELAARYRMTTGKMRERLQREEMLPQIAMEIREEKTMSHILSKARIAEAAVVEVQGEAAQAQPAKPLVAAEEEGPAAAGEAQGPKEE